ncbi:MAG: hypothetical protein KY432_00265 [Acidobacteria bacterium]|nr:hypothetical protein [Acidobacteriota bacterium]
MADVNFERRPGAARSHRKRDLYRMIVARSDITAALGTCELILDQITDLSDELLAPLYHAVVVSYARPFTANKPHGHLPSKWSKFREERLQRLHDSLIEQRHQYVAHSDADVRTVDIIPPGATIPQFGPAISLGVQVAMRLPDPGYFEDVRELCLNLGSRLNEAVSSELQELYRDMELPRARFRLRVDEGL